MGIGSRGHLERDSIGLNQSGKKNGTFHEVVVCQNECIDEILVLGESGASC